MKIHTLLALLVSSSLVHTGDNPPAPTTDSAQADPAAMAAAVAVLAKNENTDSPAAPSALEAASSSSGDLNANVADKQQADTNNAPKIRVQLSDDDDENAIDLLENDDQDNDQDNLDHVD